MYTFTTQSTVYGVANTMSAPPFAVLKKYLSCFASYAVHDRETVCNLTSGGQSTPCLGIWETTAGKAEAVSPSHSRLVERGVSTMNYVSRGQRSASKDWGAGTLRLLQFKVVNLTWVIFPIQPLEVSLADGGGGDRWRIGNQEYNVHLQLYTKELRVTFIKSGRL